MSKVHVLVRLWPAQSGYYWSVPIPEGSVIARSGDFGTSVRAALAETHKHYGAALGDVDFQLRSCGL